MYRNLILLVAALFLVPALSMAQQNTKPPYQLDLDKADNAFASKKYNTAALLYQKVYPKVKDEEEKLKVLFKIADSYRNSNNFKQALKWFEDVINSKYPDPAVLYSYGQLLKNFERYDEAGRAFYDYSFELPDDPNGKTAQYSCQVAGDWKANPVKVKVENVKDINTDQSDYSPYYSNGKIYYTSTRKESQGSGTFEWTGQKYCDLFETSVTNGIYSKPIAIKPLNSDFNEGVAWLDSTASTIYFTQCNGIDGRGVSCKIFISFYQNGTWIRPAPLPFNSDSFSIGHPAFTPDGSRMYFSSDMPGGYGKKDIWYMSYDAVRNTWGKPVNPGPGVNSPEDELFPYIDEEGTVFYSSKGFIGMGGLDIFKTADSSGTFKMAENLRYPINSGGDDFGISFIPKSRRKDGQPYAYFTSNREGGVGDDDIYSISVKPLVILVKGKVYDRETGGALSGALVTAQTEAGERAWKIKTNDKGLFSGELPYKLNTGISGSLEKYLSSTPQFVNTTGFTNDTVIEVNIPLDAVPSDDVELTLQGIYYDLDKWDLRPEAKVILDSLALILKNNPSIVIELASHTDSRAPAEYNLDLSKKRAKSCVDYLVSKGIVKERLIPVGYGETKLVNDCSDGVDCTEEEHQQNRRTTIRILRTDFKSRR